MYHFLKLTYPLIFIVLIACQNKETEQNTQTLNLQSKEISLSYAQNFKIEQFEDFKVLTLTKPFTDSPDSLQYVLYKRGEEKPEGFKEAIFIEIPIQRVVVLSHSHIAFLQKMGLENNIVGINEGNYLPEIPFKQKLKKGEVKDVSNAQGVLNLEEILSLEPDLVIFSSGAKEGFLKNKVLTEAGIPMVFNGEWLETNPLGRAEWIKMMSLFFDKEKQANQIFEEITQAYQSVTLRTDSIKTKPTVLWEVPYKDTWYVPGGNSYIAKLLKDAGGNYLWQDDEQVASLALDFETVYAKAQQADYWISLSVIQKKSELQAQDARFTDLKAFKEGNLYNHNRQKSAIGGSLYLMEGVVNPHWVLSDLVKILHPNLLSAHEFRYYQKIE
jgi:iron complex transport system substrate-binding protein